MLVNSELLLTGTTLMLNDVPYFLSPQSAGQFRVNLSTNSLGPFDFRPITVITSEAHNFGISQLREVVDKFSRDDDVFQKAFLEGIYVQNTQSGNTKFCDQTFQQCTTIQEAAMMGNTTVTVPQGPYFLSASGSLFQAFRLYSDSQGSFSESVLALGDETFMVLPANLPGQSLAVAVPSRLYFTKSAFKPLAGVRIGIKDIFDLKGIKTSNSNRAWYRMYKEASRSAPTVQNLIDAGAVIVGKMKTSQFANGETATADWVDYHAPFNPRGDGYQDGSSSSTGPASGAASYSWLDVTLGSDTGGSIRSPSQLQGLYGNRPTHGLVSMEGVMPLAPEFDTPGLFARDPQLWLETAEALYGLSKDDKSKSALVVNEFLRNLTGFLSGNVTAYDVEATWTTDNQGQQPLPVLLNQTYELLTAKQQARLVRDKFYSDYAAKYGGRLPHVDPSPLLRWSFGDNSTTTVDELVATKDKFATWFNEKTLPRDPDTCSKNLLMYARNPKPVYRDVYLTGPSRPLPFSTSRLSVYSGAPDVVVPIGEMEYNSTVTKHNEVLPVTINLMAAKGCDGMIFSLIRDLHAAGLLPTVETGTSLVHGGEILL